MKWGKWALAIAVVLAVKGVGGLPKAREMEQLQLVDTLAVDGGERVTVTAVTAVRASEQENSEVLRGEGKDLGSACQALQGESARRAYLGQTGQLLLGEDADVAAALDFAADERQLRLDTLLYIVRGQAGPGLEASAGLVANETAGEDPRAKTVGEILPRLAEGERVLVPALAPGEEGVLEPGGWAVLERWGLVGFLDDAVGTMSI